MPLIASEQAKIEQTIANALRDVSRPNPFRLKAGLRILMTTNLEIFGSVCSLGVQRDLSDFKKLLLKPESIAPQSTKTETDRIATLNFIKQHTLKNLFLLDDRTAILPNTYMVKKSIMEGERLKSVIHTSALRNLVTNAHYFDSLEKKFKEEGIPPEQIESQVKKAIASTHDLHKAVLEGNLSEVLKSLAIHGVDVNFPDEQGMTPLHLATREGHTETVKMLLTVPSIQINLLSNNGWTALHIAARMGYADIADALLTMPMIDPNRVNSDGWSALHWAAWHGFTEVVTVLLTAPGILVNLADQNSTTPLHLAARNGHPDVIMVLHSVPNLDINLTDNEQRTPLLMAVIYNHEAAVKTLLSFPEIELNHVDMDGSTPLHWAARNGNIGILKALLSHKDTFPEEVDNNRMTPLDWAIHNGHMEALKFLKPHTFNKSQTSFLNRLSNFVSQKLQKNRRST